MCSAPRAMDSFAWFSIGEGLFRIAVNALVLAADEY